MWGICRWVACGGFGAVAWITGSSPVMTDQPSQAVMAGLDPAIHVPLRTVPRHNDVR
jgi:hypothetical protein